MTNPTEAPMANAIDDVKEWAPVAFRWTYSIEEGGRILGPFYGSIAPDLNEYPNSVVMPLYASPAPSQHTGWSDEAVEEEGRDALGRRVREAWVKWALTQPNPKPSWLVPYDELSEPDKEADRQIGQALQLTRPDEAIIKVREEIYRLLSKYQSHCDTDHGRRSVLNHLEVFISALTQSDAEFTHLDEAAAASSIAPATGFEVKDLQWRHEPWGVGNQNEVWRGYSGLKTYEAAEYALGSGETARLRWVVGGLSGEYLCQEDAFAAAQADFDSRIRSSISPSVAKESGEP